MKTLFYNAKITTMDTANPKVSSMLVETGCIIKVGDNISHAEADSVVDMKGAIIYPAFIESHAHIKNTGWVTGMLDLVGKNKDEILSLVREAVKITPEGEFIMGRGWSQVYWGGEMPSRWELDDVAPNHPVVLTRMCGHSQWVNSQTLCRAHIDDTTSDPKGGRIVRDECGVVTGILEEYAMDPVLALMKSGDESCYMDAERYFFERGITTVVDAGISKDEIATYHKLYRDGMLKMRTYAMIHADHMDGIIEDGIKCDMYGGKFNLRGVKFLLDGSLGQRSAWMLEDYHDKHGYRGVHCYNDNELYKKMKKAHDLGYQISVHIIGDAALEQVLKCFERINYDEVTKMRHRLEHFQTTSTEQIQRASDMKLLASMQPVHLCDDISIIEERLGDFSKAFRIKDMMECGMTLCFGSDSPVMDAYPFHSVHGAVNRTSFNNFSYVADSTQCIGVEDAMRAFTVDAAFAIFEEERIGRLGEGYVADFVVFGEEPTEVDRWKLKDVEIEKTYVGGKMVYGKGVSQIGAT